jgi:hypothetical protein
MRVLLIKKLRDFGVGGRQESIATAFIRQVLKESSR